MHLSEFEWKCIISGLTEAIAKKQDKDGVPLSDVFVAQLGELQGRMIAEPLRFELSLKDSHMVLAFRLPDQEHEARAAMCGLDAVLALHDIMEEVLRPKIKWPPEGQPEAVTAMLEQIRTEIYGVIQTRKLEDVVYGE